MIIGLAGRMGSGKDTVGKMLVDHLGFERLAFGDELKREVSDLLADWKSTSSGNLSGKAKALLSLMASEAQYSLRAGNVERFVNLSNLPSLLYLAARDGVTDPWEKPTPQLMRSILQIWGTEFRRGAQPDYWVRKLKGKKIPGRNYVITDLRFPNEKGVADYVFWVSRDSAESNPAEHESERAISAADCESGIISNNGTLEDLRALVYLVGELVLVPGNAKGKNVA